MNPLVDARIMETSRRLPTINMVIAFAVGNYRVLFDFYEEIKIVSIEEVKKRDERTY